MATSFQEFLQKKLEGTDWRERGRRRQEWLGALDRLLNRIQVDLRESDPERLLEVVPYLVVRAEEKLGVYDAPALKIHLGTATVDVLPIARYGSVPFALRDLQAISGNERRWGGLSGGRVDITDGERRVMLFRDIEGEPERWYAVPGDRLIPESFDRDRLEAVLQDLLR